MSFSLAVTNKDSYGNIVTCLFGSIFAFNNCFTSAELSLSTAGLLLATEPLSVFSVSSSSSRNMELKSGF